MPTTESKIRTAELQLWDKIELRSNRYAGDGPLLSRIEEIGENYLIISRPSSNAAGFSPKIQGPVMVQYCREDAMYQAMAELTEYDHNCMKLDGLEDFERMQRRDYVRIPFNLDLKYCLIKDESVVLEERYRFWKESHTKDLSAGGLLMQIDDDIKPDDVIMIRIPNYDNMGIPRLISAVCCRVMSVSSERYAGVQFIVNEKIKKYFSDIDLNLLPPQVLKFDLLTQNHLVNFIFAEQINRRQKERD